MRTLAIAVLVLALRADAKPRQLEEPPIRPTTHEIAACLDAPDQSICILRGLAASPAHIPYRYDLRFAHASDVLAAIGPIDMQTREDPSRSDDEFWRHGFILYRESRRAVIEALEADRRGVSAADALARIRNIADSSAAVRCSAYMSIWEAYGGAEDWAHGSTGYAPSLDLTRAALAACEGELPALRPFAELPLGPVRLPAARYSLSVATPVLVARGYAALNDVDAVRRVMRNDPRDENIVRIETAILLGDLDAAAEAAGKPMPASSDAQIDLMKLRTRVRELARVRDRRDLITAIAIANINDAVTLKNWEFVGYRFGGARFPETDAIVLAEIAPRNVAVEHLARLDAAGRDTESPNALTNAIAAVAGWMKLNEPERAHALLDTWAPLARPAREGRSDEGGRRFCIGCGVVIMLHSMGRLDEAREKSLLTPLDAILFDMHDGRSPERLGQHLRLGTTDWSGEDILGICVEQAAYDRRFDWIEACAGRLIARDGHRPLTDDERLLLRDYPLAAPGSVHPSSPIGWGPYGAAAVAIDVAHKAWRGGAADLANSMLREALLIWRDAPEVAMDERTMSELEGIAVAQLQAAGRL